jgi:thiol-disulfide isomerase/thioredoxin
MLTRPILVFLLSLSCIQLSLANNSEPNTFDLTLTSDEAISIKKFGNDGDRILWIPSEHGINKTRHFDLLSALSKLQFEVWLTEPHESYFIPPGRSSYTKIPVNDISELIQKSLPEDNRKLFIVSTGRGAVLSLLALNHWQNKTGGSEKFGGVIMLHPNFQATTPTPGTAMEYLPIVDSTQLPIFIMQPKMSNKYWYLNDLVAKLTDSGSQVYTQIIDQVGDGYHVRSDATEIENQKAKELPLQLSKALHLLAQAKVTPQKQQDISKQPWQVTSLPESLQPYPEGNTTPALELHDIKGKKYKLDDFRGKVVVLNFWATWCPPCVKEIPSLGRLQKTFSKKELLVLSVDIGENKKDIETFLEQVPADFPVLLNPDGSTVKQWKIIAFPTTFVINQQGTIELAYYGAREWDEPNIVAQLQSLVKRLQK